MKFMDQVMTPRGPGAVIGRVGAWGVQVAILKENLIGNRCSGPCVNLVFKEDEITLISEARSSKGARREGGADGRR